MADSPREHFRRQEAVALLGRRIRTEVEFSGVPAGTAGIVVRADPAGTQRAYTVGIQWQLDGRQQPLVDWFTKSEYDRFLKEENSMAQEEKKHFITGNTFEVKDQLKELGCRWDAEAGQWYHANRKVAAQAQKLVPAGPEKHVIGQAPYELKERLKELGAKWDQESSQWYHSDKEAAARAQQMIAEAGQRHYLTGNAHDVKEQLKALGCQWDVDTKQWYHTDKEVAARAQAVVDKGPEKHFIQGNCYPLPRPGITSTRKRLPRRRSWSPRAPASTTFLRCPISSMSG